MRLKAAAFNLVFKHHITMTVEAVQVLRPSKTLVTEA